MWIVSSVQNNLLKLKDVESNKLLYVPLKQLTFRKDLSDPDGNHVFIDDIYNNIFLRASITENIDIFLQNLKIDSVESDPLKEDIINKDTDVTLSDNSDIKYPSQKAVKTYVDDNARLSSFNVVNVKKNPGLGEFLTISDALNSIVTNSANNKFLIKVGAGLFIEDELEMKPHVYVEGSGEDVTTIQVNAANKHVIVGSDYSSIEHVTLTGAGTGYAAVYFSSPTSTTLLAFDVNRVKFGANDILVKVEAPNNPSSVFINNCTIGSENQFNYGFIATNTGSGAGRILIRNTTTTGMSQPYPNTLAIADGVGCEIIMNGVQLRVPSVSGIGIKLTNGGRGRLIGVNLRGFATGILMENVGSAPSMIATSINFENCTMDLDVQHPSADGIFHGIVDRTTSFISPTSTVIINTEDRQIIRVAKLDADYSSIYDAINSITDNSNSKRYKILVGPGIFIEPELDLSTKPYISIVGSSILSTIVRPDSSTHHIFKLGAYNELSFLNLQNAGSGFAGIAALDCGDFAQAHKISFDNCDIGVKVTSSTQDTYFYGEYLDFNGLYTYGTYIKSENGFIAFANLENYYNIPEVMVPDTLPYGTFVTGPNADVHILAAGFFASMTGTGLYVEDGAEVEINSTHFDDWKIGIHVGNVGAAPKVSALGTQIKDGILYDLLIEHPGATGAYQGAFDMSNISIDSDSTFNINVQNTIDGSQNISNKLNLKYNDGTLTDISTLFTGSSAMGVLEGGDLSDGGGFTLNVSAGLGYLSQSIPEHIIKKHVWNNTSLILSANQDVYIYFDTSLTLVSSSSFPDTTQNIILGRVITNDTVIKYISGSSEFIHHVPNKLIKFNRRALGPIYRSGSSVSEFGVRGLDVSSGEYYYGVNEILTTGGSNIDWSAYYKNGVGGYTEVSSQNVIDNSFYDDGSGTLAAMTASYFVKHSLYTIGEGVNEKYILVYAQDEYATLLEAQEANIPTPPTFVREAVVLIAGIIVQQGSANIIQIRDLRPVIGFKAEGVNASADHGSLLGLTGDDHPQYLLVNGSRAMTSNLNMGGQNINNVNLVDGVDISSHASRHLPNGSDPLTTAAPTTNLGGSSTNSVGIQNSFSRSDHSHAMDIANGSQAGILSSTDWNTFNNKQNALGFTPEDIANKDIDDTLTANSDTKYPSQKAVKTYVDTGLSAKQNTLGFTPENIANKDIDGTLSANSDTRYPSQKAIKTYVDTLDTNNIKKTGSVAFTGNQSMGDNRLTNVANPISAQDAATKNYVDNVTRSNGQIGYVDNATTLTLTTTSTLIPGTYVLLSGGTNFSMVSNGIIRYTGATTIKCEIKVVLSAFVTVSKLCEIAFYKNGSEVSASRKRQTLYTTDETFTMTLQDYAVATNDEFEVRIKRITATNTTMTPDFITLSAIQI